MQYMMVGDSQTVEVQLKTKEKPLGMLVSIISTPSCMDVNMNELEILKERALIDNFEISPDKTSIYLYWTSVKNPKKISFTRVQQFGATVC